MEFGASFTCPSCGEEVSLFIEQEDEEWNIEICEKQKESGEETGMEEYELDEAEGLEEEPDTGMGQIEEVENQSIDVGEEEEEEEADEDKGVNY